MFLLGLHNPVMAISFEGASYPELSTSSRALAMGNAFICKVDDGLAAFYNPAGLGTVRKSHLYLSNMHLEMNKGWMDIGGKGSVSEIPSDFVNGFSLDGTRELLLDNRGTISHTRFHAMPNFTTRHISLGYLLSKKLRATLGTDSGDLLEYATRLDYGPYMAMNLSLFGGVLKLGNNIIWLNRHEAIAEVDPNVEIDLGDGDYKKGNALIFTSGLKFTMPVTFLPTFAIVMHNSTGKTFSGRAAGAPNKIPQTIDVGFSLTPKIGRAIRVHMEFNYKDIRNKYSDINSNRKLLAGIEFDFSRVMYVRFGYGDGYGSAGVGVRSDKLEVDLTTYAVDTSNDSFRGEEDRRFSLTLSSGL